VEETEALQQTAGEPVEEIDEITERIQENLDGEGVQLSTGDLMRLLEFRVELGEPQTIPFIVGWFGECQQTLDE
jgi:hypothetical protein